MAAVRWGEASHPGPGRARRRARRNDDGALEAWRNLVAAYREERTARTRHTQAEWRELIASRRTALRLDLVDRRRAPPAAAAVGQPVAPALCVPVGWSRVSARDNVPHLSDGDGNPYYVTEDGTFWVRRRDSAGVERNIQVAFDEHTHAALVLDFVELGDLVIDCPPPVLVPAGGEPPQEATRGVLSSPPSSAAAAAPPAAPAAPLSASPTSFRPSTPHPTGADHNGPGAETVDEGEGVGGGGVAGRAVEGASKAPEPSVFGRGDEVEHRDVHGDWWPAEVVEVHYDDCLQPYYAVDVRDRVVDTGPGRLRRRTPSAPSGGRSEDDRDAVVEADRSFTAGEAGANETTPIATTAVRLRHDGLCSTSLRAPVDFYFMYPNIGLTAGVTGIGGVSVVGGCDSSPRRRAELERRCFVRADEDARDVPWSERSADVVMASVKSAAFSIDHSVGARLAARTQHHRAVRAVLASGATVGVVESMWQVTTCEEGSYFKDLVREAALGGYATRYRAVSPHRHGGSEVRPRMYLLFVQESAIALAGEPDLVSGDREASASSCRRLLTPGTVRREAVPSSAVRWRQHPEKIGGAVRLGHYGRGGLKGSVWSVDAAVPPRCSNEESPVFWLDGACVRLTPREEARARGLPDSVDIGELDGSTTARRRVAEASSVPAVAAVASVVRDFVRRVWAARRLAPPERDAAQPGRAAPPPRLRRSPNHAPQYCTRSACEICDKANLTLSTSRGDFSAASAWQRLESYCFRWLATRHPSAFLAAGEEAAHRRVVSALTDNLHGFRYIRRDGQVVRTTCTRRDLIFWRFSDPTMRAWARDGAPAFAVHPRPPPTRRDNYDSGNGVHARDMFRGFHDDGIIAHVDTATAEEALRSGSAAITPITLIPKKTPGKFRLLTDARASGTNWALGHLPSHFPTALMAIRRVVAPGDWVGGFDVMDYFYSFPLRDEDTWLFLVRTSDGYYRYVRLPQGSKTSPYVGLRFTYHTLEEWRETRTPLHVVVQEPGAPDFDPSAPAVLWLDAEGERVEVTQHLHVGEVGGHPRLACQVRLWPRPAYAVAEVHGARPGWS